MKKVFQRLIPDSLAGRMVFIIILTLLAAQTLNLFVSAHQRQNLIRQHIYDNAISRYIEHISDYQNDEGIISDIPTRRFVRGRRRIWQDTQSQFTSRNLFSEPQIVNLLREKLQEREIKVQDIQGHYGPMPSRRFLRESSRASGNDSERSPLTRRFEKQTIDSTRNDQRRPLSYAMSLSIKLNNGQWINGIYRSPPPPYALQLRDYLVNGSILGLFLMLAMIAFAFQIRRPLKELLAASDQIGRQRHHDQRVALIERGPTEIHDAMSAFNQMTYRVDDLLAEKDVMLGAIGHDLRTPLTALRLRLEQMGPEEQQEKAIFAVEEISNLLDDILELARAASAGNITERHNFKTCVENLVQDYQEMGKEVVFDVESGGNEEFYFTFNPQAIRRLLRNLIDNALVYGKEAALSLRVEGGSVGLEIVDNGPGIKDEDMEAMQRPFIRGDRSRNRRSGGTGLGLAIARSIAHSHHGELILENRVSGGLRVTLNLPR